MAGSGNSGRSVSPKQIVVGVLIIVVVVLAIANSKKVPVDLVIHDFTMPLFIVIVGSALIGWVIGWFMGNHRD